MWTRPTSVCQVTLLSSFLYSTKAKTSKVIPIHYLRRNRNKTQTSNSRKLASFEAPVSGYCLCFCFPSPGEKRYLQSFETDFVWWKRPVLQRCVGHWTLLHLIKFVHLYFVWKCVRQLGLTNLKKSVLDIVIKSCKVVHAIFLKLVKNFVETFEN